MSSLKWTTTGTSWRRVEDLWRYFNDISEYIFYDRIDILRYLFGRVYKIRAHGTRGRGGGFAVKSCNPIERDSYLIQPPATADRSPLLSVCLLPNPSRYMTYMWNFILRLRSCIGSPANERTDEWTDGRTEGNGRRGFTLCGMTVWFIADIANLRDVYVFIVCERQMSCFIIWDKICMSYTHAARTERGDPSNSARSVGSNWMARSPGPRPLWKCGVISVSLTVNVRRPNRLTLSDCEISWTRFRRFLVRFATSPSRCFWQMEEDVRLFCPGTTLSAVALPPAAAAAVWAVW